MNKENHHDNSNTAVIQKETLDKLRLHFVFNTLHAIRYLIKKQPDVACDMVYDLSKYLRGSCDAIVRQELVPVEDELAFAKAYARLEEVQRSRLTVSWQTDGVWGYVMAGRIYSEIEALLKQDAFGSKELRTLAVTSGAGTDVIRICIVETGNSVEIPILKEEDK